MLCAASPSFAVLSTTLLVPLPAGTINCAGIIAIVVLALSPLSCWHSCPHHTGIVAIAVMLLLPSSCWRLCCRCSGVFAIVEQAPCAGATALIMLAFLKLKRRTSSSACASAGGLCSCPPTNGRVLSMEEKDLRTLAGCSTRNALAGSPFRRIVIVGAPMKKYNVNNTLKMELFYDPAPCCEKTLSAILTPPLPPSALSEMSAAAASVMRTRAVVVKSRDGGALHFLLLSLSLLLRSSLVCRLVVTLMPLPLVLTTLPHVRRTLNHSSAGTSASRPTWLIVATASHRAATSHCSAVSHGALPMPCLLQCQCLASCCANASPCLLPHLPSCPNAPPMPCILPRLQLLSSSASAYLVTTSINNIARSLAPSLPPFVE